MQYGWRKGRIVYFTFYNYAKISIQFNSWISNLRGLSTPVTAYKGLVEAETSEAHRVITIHQHESYQCNAVILFVDQNVNMYRILKVVVRIFQFVCIELISCMSCSLNSFQPLPFAIFVFKIKCINRLGKPPLQAG